MFSFIRARDPSILTTSLKQFDQIKKKIDEEYDETAVPIPEEENLQVFLRLKLIENSYSDLYEINDKTLICKVPAGSHFMRNVQEGDSITRKYTFSHIFDENVTQKQIFNDIIKSKILDFINGKNGTILTYGASGAGKTYTIVGTDTQPGIVPRSLEYLFKSLPELRNEPTVKPNCSGKITFLSDAEKLQEIHLRNKVLNATSMANERIHHIRTYKNMQQRISSEPVAMIDELKGVSVSIWVSFAEIYNEYIYDLLQFNQSKNKQREKLKLGKDSRGQVYIKDLTSIHVSSGVEAYQILQYGLQYLQYASTTVNSHSSRSHCIFTIKLVQLSANKKDFIVTFFNFADLAGSERLKKTMNKGDRLKESNNINASLLVLHRCITIVRNAQKGSKSKVAPFRESKLTQLFQNALSGQESIYMIVNINPIINMYDESQHVLNFSAIAKDIIVESQKPSKLEKDRRFSEYIEARSTIAPPKIIVEECDNPELLEKVEQLYMEIDRLKYENEASEVKIRTEITDNFVKLMDNREVTWKQRIKDLEEEHLKEKQYWQAQLESLEHERQSKKRKLDDSVIVLDDSISSQKSNNEDLYNQLDALQKQTLEKEKEIQELKLKLLDKERMLCEINNYHEEEVEALESKIKLLKNEVCQLQEQQSIINAYDEVKSIQLYKVQDKIERLENSFKDSAAVNNSDDPFINETALLEDSHSVDNYSHKLLESSSFLQSNTDDNLDPSQIP